MVRSIGDTAAGLGEDGAAWQRLFGPSAAHFDALNEDLLRPILHLPRHPVRLARFGLPAAAPATLLARRWEHAAGPGAVRRRRRALLQPPDAADERRRSAWR